jgi:hypothetical protein
MYKYFYMERFRVYATNNGHINSVHKNNHHEISYKTKWSLHLTIIKYSHSYHTHIILQCPKIYHRYKDNILIWLFHHNHFTQHGKCGTSNELLLCFTFSQAKYLGLAKPKGAHDICNICINLPM